MTFGGSRVLACALAAIGAAQAQTAIEHVIHSFGNFPRGANPYGTLTRDAANNLYGTTYQGGAANAGVVFELDASGQQTVLYSFTGGADGANPYAGVIHAFDGSLYGTTCLGGAANAGVVYKVDPAGHEKVLYSFTGGADGAHPYAGLMADSAGNLYGTTASGGTANAGVVYKLDPSGHLTVLYTFTGRADGGSPYGGVIADAAGNLYGTTRGGGTGKAGVVYKLDPSGRETVLHTFGAPHAGEAPSAGVVRDAAGNLYGTATNVVFKLDAEGQYTVLTDFPTWTTGGEASAGVFLDAAGNLYGTTDMVMGQVPTLAPFGAVYELDTRGHLTVLYDFPGASEAGDLTFEANPGVIVDPAGNVYGATSYGGVSGMLYEVDTAKQETTLYSFSGAPGGSLPFGGVIGDAAGDLWGTAGNGGAANAGVLYEVNAAGQEIVLHSFADGVGMGVARDSAGNLYGTAGFGTLGEVYKVDPSGQYTVLYQFTGGADGTGSNGVLVDPAGNVFGSAGGGAAGAGLLFKLDASGHYAVLYTFTGGGDGSDPNPGLIRDPWGNLYGTTFRGGAAGAGVLFELEAAGQFRVLHSFAGFGPGGGNPFAGVIRDPQGNLYGTTVNYGVGGGGVVYELGASGDYKVLYSFNYGADGGAPFGGVVRDAAGNLYGTTTGGGEKGCFISCGVVYKLDPSGNETVLHSFTGGVDGSYPYAGVMLDAAGNLYGTTVFGGAAEAGVLYKITFQ
ncbi:MAG: choice-of-anchor tandem repeat GloVer-containing protein [Bryobacteraceae bacterium]|jgi:uncharacterized repeat protein (TIGR03803 family)